MHDACILVQVTAKFCFAQDREDKNVSVLKMLIQPFLTKYF